jgi:hypothetical protein
MTPKRVMRDNPIIRTPDKRWGKGKPFTRFRYYQAKKTGRRISKAYAKSHPRSVKIRHGYTSKLTGKPISQKVLVQKSGPEAWMRQGLLESTADKKFKSAETRQRWSQKLLKTLKEFRSTQLPPKGSPDLRRYLEYLKAKRSDFYDALTDANLAPGDPNYFYEQDDFDLAADEGVEE